MNDMLHRSSYNYGNINNYTSQRTFHNGLFLLVSIQNKIAAHNTYNTLCKCQNDLKEGTVFLFYGEKEIFSGIFLNTTNFLPFFLHVLQKFHIFLELFSASYSLH